MDKFLQSLGIGGMQTTTPMTKKLNITAPSILPSGSISSFSTAPKPTASSILTSNAGATATAPKPITPATSGPVGSYGSYSSPTTSALPKAGQDYVSQMASWSKQNNLTQNPDGSYSAGRAAPSPVSEASTSGVGGTSSASQARDAYISAYRAYQNAQRSNADVSEAKRAYNEFLANQAKSIAGKEGQGRGIPLAIVRGEQERLLKQTQPEALRLQGDIGIAESARQSEIDAMKSEAELQKELLGLETEENKPIEIGGALYQKQPDGSYKAIIEAPTKGAEGFTLGKDQVRYDAQGNVIAGSISSTGADAYGGTYTPGANPSVDAWVKGIQSGTYKPSDVPNELQNAVAQALSQIPKPQSEISKNVVSIINDLLLDPNTKSISGYIQGKIGLGSLLPGAQLAINKYDQLRGLLSLDNIKYLKGTGAISDAEQRLLANAASSLGRNLSDEQFMSVLTKLRDDLAGLKTIQPDEEEYLRSIGYTPEQIEAYQRQSFNTVGNTKVSIPQSSRLALINNNPGNLRFAGQAGAVPGEGGFARFSSPEAGLKALENQIKLDASRGLTLAQFISKYAPPTENDTRQYINQIVQMTGATSTTPIRNIDLTNLTKAIALKESGTRIG